MVIVLKLFIIVLTVFTMLLPEEPLTSTQTSVSVVKDFDEYVGEILNRILKKISL